MDNQTDVLKQLSLVELAAGLTEVRQSPHDSGTLAMIVTRPGTDLRVVQETAELSPEFGVVGDNWIERGSKRTPDGSAHPEMQITLMNSRVIGLLAQDRARWPLAGDQLIVDLDLSEGNLQPGQQLRLGTALLEVTAIPHTGCNKFSERFGLDALRWVSSPEGREMRLRGMYARVIQPGAIRVGDMLAVNR